MITTRDLLFGVVLTAAVVAGGLAGSLLGDLTHLVAGAVTSGGLVYAIYRLLGWF